ncbi:amidohydrolase, imidazolonepropionase [Desulfocapsa sulfexigens DSM 10523]|uniref:Amidohydrolase, imidazolonepropionase n=2 Tax=Desulfocapsa TaxID=53318 RepID=M1PJQ7_DESSD|nr:amidohydrolase, imidazolonepropionase [Desulfocapsa sulfexigens DSM 10523]
MSGGIHYVKAGWMIDGSGGPVRENVLVTVKDSILVEIDDFSDSDHPDSPLITDLSHCTILPPLVDCHVHLAMSGSTDLRKRQRQLTAGYRDRRISIQDHLHYLFLHGVLAVRDGGDSNGDVLRYTEETEGGDTRVPVIVKSPGPAWYRDGRYGAFIGDHSGEGESIGTAVARRIDSVDHIKMINSGLNSFTEFARETEPQFSVEEIQQIAAITREKGKKLMVHANGREPVRIALDGGCDSLEHGFFMGEENLKRMAEKEITWVPTAITMKAILDNWDLLDDGRCKKDVIVKTLNHQLEQIGRAHQYGVKIALGTDAGCRGVIHGESVVEEIRLLISAGYSLVEAIQSASGNGTQLLGIDEIGPIAKGRPAHFIVARATPAMLPRKLSCLEAVYLDGKPCGRAFFKKI